MPDPGKTADVHKVSLATLGSLFSHAAQWTSVQCGRASTFIVACFIIIVWAAMGPVFRFSDTWQLVINTGTTIVTFLMVFLIQNTQNRDMAVLHLKLDELIRVSKDARNTLLDLEGMTEEELARLKDNFSRLAASDDAVGGRLAGVEDELTHAQEEITAAKREVAGAISSRAEPARHDSRGD